ncbi:MAG TPA: response regulator [Accumulibacter sp.]|uniref:response regulator n=1 Tax=Accumulibacter sp. TaxID=2053492 RepID=UPI00235B5F90|nr:MULTISPECIES: response regulator [Candidatus Accumulibacter]HNC21101.1 response regulator [Accumulibacter sp.]HNF92145.1 response regulator [Accumulibacter sp.]HNO14116.1 response regulator [Accumulibacter sp.]HNO73239.1 response regulator [Accumulibacter sp.]
MVNKVYVMRMLEHETLEQFGFGVTEADDGKQALAILDEPPRDLVLPDVEMPGIDGFEVCLLDCKEGFGTAAFTSESKFLGNSMASVLPSDEANTIQQVLDLTLLARLSNSMVARLFIDLDDFNRVNDTFGWGIGCAAAW